MIKRTSNPKKSVSSATGRTSRPVTQVKKVAKPSIATKPSAPIKKISKDKSKFNTCNNCGHDKISPSARNCPECGHPMGKINWLMDNKWLLLITSIASIASLIGFNEDWLRNTIGSEINPSQKTTQENSKPQESPTISPSSKKCPTCKGFKEIRCVTCERHGRKGYLPCSVCNASGEVVCDRCNGTGTMTSYHGHQVIGICQKCNGTRKAKCAQCTKSGYNVCPSCNGSGYFPCHCQ